MLLCHLLARMCPAVGGLRGVLRSTYTNGNLATAVAFTGPYKATLYELGTMVNIDCYFPYLGRATAACEIPSGGNAASFNLPDGVCKKGRHYYLALLLLTFVSTCYSSAFADVAVCLLLLLFFRLFVCSFVWCLVL